MEDFESSGFIVTDHAAVRLQQRGISMDTVSEVLKHGVKMRVKGGRYARMVSRSKSRLLRRNERISSASLEKALGVCVVTEEDENRVAVVTVLPRRQGRLNLRVA